MRTIPRAEAFESEVDSEGTWAISYGDMVTLLLTFFILFFSVSKNAPGSASSEKTRQSAMALHLTSQLGSKEEKPGVGSEILPLDPYAATVHRIGTKIVVEFPGISFFKFTKTDLTPEGKNALARFSQSYLPYAGGYQVSVRAYTDEKPVRYGAHRFQDNMELSVLRSVTALRFLQKAGIPLRRLKPGGFGEIRAPASNSTTAEPVRSRTKGSPMARKIVLVLEPVPRDAL
ncbi:MAG: OmpA family protein [Bdellovibrionales bacterium]|nr:OmpA family protein [Bdellovibrionales bacterium]